MSSGQRTQEQIRAAQAYRHVTALHHDHRKLYGTLALKLPALLRTSGLCQAVHFLKSRNKDAANSLLENLGEQLGRIDPEIRGMDSLCKRAREAEFANYLWLSREAFAVATWYARLAKSELKVEPGDDE